MEPLFLPKSKSYFAFLYGLALLFSSIVASAQIQVKRQTKHGYISKFGPNAFIGYLAYTPKDYDANPSKKYPLLIFLHGKGEKAWMPTDTSQLDTVAKNGPPQLIEAGQDFPFIVISPQCPFEGWDDVSMDNYATSVSKPGQLVDEILEKIKKLYRVDETRIYLTGLSMGGAGTWNYIVNYPQKIAAAIPISGWIDDQSKVCNIASYNVGVWSFHGGNDKTTNTQGIVDFVNSCQPAPKEEAKITFFAGVGHDAWTKAYNNTGEGIAPDNIYDWLLRHSKGSLVVTDVENEVGSNKALKIYPVPAKNFMNVQLPLQDSEEAIIEILNEHGLPALATSFLVIGPSPLPLDLSLLADGMYIVNVTSPSFNLTSKLVITK